MKILGIISTLVLLLSFSKIDGQIIKIKGTQEYCQNGNDDYVDRYIRLKKDGKIIRNSIENKEGKFVIKNLRKGNYKIEFINIFGQTIQKDIDANRLKSKIKICVEEFEDTGEETFFQKLTSENTLELNFNSWGCSHWGKEELKILDGNCDWNGYYKMRKEIFTEIH